MKIQKDKVLAHTCQNCLFNDIVRCFLRNPNFTKQPQDKVNKCKEFQQ